MAITVQEHTQRNQTNHFAYLIAGGHVQGSDEGAMLGVLLRTNGCEIPSSPLLKIGLAGTTHPRRACGARELARYSSDQWEHQAIIVVADLVAVLCPENAFHSSAGFGVVDHLIEKVRAEGLGHEQSLGVDLLVSCESLASTDHSALYTF